MASGSAPGVASSAAASRPWCSRSDGRRQERDDRLADAVVDRLDDLASVAQAGADEALRLSSATDASSRLPASRRRRRACATGSGRPADGDDLERGAARRRAGARGAGATISSSVTAAEASRSVRRRRPVAADELLDEERAAADSRAMPRAHVRWAASSGLAEQREREARASSAGERADRDLAHLGACGQLAAHLGRNGLASASSVPVRHHEEQRRRVRRAHQLERAARRCRRRPTARRR